MDDQRLPADCGVTPKLGQVSRQDNGCMDKQTYVEKHGEAVVEERKREKEHLEGALNNGQVDNLHEGVEEEMALKEEVSMEEHALAQQLKKLCNRRGVERRENLGESAEVFLEMGKLYLQKAIDNTGMLQKLSFIRCHALLMGARVRFEMENMQEKIEQTDEVLQSSNAQLMRFCSAENAVDLITFSNFMKQKIIHERERSNKEIQKIPSRPDDQSITDFENLKLDGDPKFLAEKIEIVRSISRGITVFYKEALKEIARKCIEILGNPPCKFAMAGLGSLARQETTLYSDFEHVIILEDAVSQTEQYTKVKEYFRWFAVLFQVIIVTFGETFIRSVGIKSINDLYSEDKRRNWYVDDYTPCGIAFDGMAPHACNNPFGRQVATDARPHVVELIQSARKMASYLTRDEELKNGYYVKDVLAQTCMLFGDQEVYDTFLKYSQEIGDSEDISMRMAAYKDKVQNKIAERVNTHGIRFSVQQHNIKATMYRPATVLLSCIAERFQISTESTFDAVVKLAEAGMFDDGDALGWKYWVALAIEARLKGYAIAQNQRHRVSVPQLLSLIGLPDATWFNFLIRVLRSYAGRLVEYDGATPPALEEHDAPYFYLEALKGTGQFEKTIKYADFLHMHYGDVYGPLILMLKAIGYAGMVYSDSDPENIRRMFYKAIDAYKEALKIAGSRDQQVEILTHLSNCYNHVEDRQGEYEVTKMVIDFEDDEAVLEFYLGKLNCGGLTLINDASLLAKVLKSLKATLRHEESPKCRLKIGLLVAKVEMKLDAQTAPAARKEIATMVDEISRRYDEAHELGYVFLEMLKDILKDQYENEWWEDGLKTIDCIVDLQGADKMEAENYAYDVNREFGYDNRCTELLFYNEIELMKARCLFMLERYDTCIDFIESDCDKIKHPELLKQLAACYVSKAENAEDEGKRIALIKKAIATCHLIEDKEVARAAVKSCGKLIPDLLCSYYHNLCIATDDEEKLKISQSAIEYYKTVKDFGESQPSITPFENAKIAALFNLGRFDECMRYIEDEVGTGKRERRIYVLYLCCIIKAHEEQNQNEILRLSVKALSYCKALPPSEYDTKRHVAALSCVFMSRDARAIMKHYAEAPPQVQTHADIGVAIDHFLLKILDDIADQYQITRAEMDSVMSRYFLDPFVCYCCALQLDTDDALNEDYKIAMKVLGSKFFHTHRVPGKGFMVAAFNRGLLCMSETKMRECVEIMWHVVNKAATKAFIHRNSAKFLIAGVLGVMAQKNSL